MEGRLTFAQTINVGSITANVCQGGTINVPFTVNGTFNAGNVFTAQLSNNTGSFLSPVDLGLLSGTTGGSIIGLVSYNQVPGNGYRIRVVSSSPTIISTDNGSDIVINSTPAITISDSPNTVICRNAKVTFFATTINGGNNPAFQWLKNNIPIPGANNVNYIDSNLNDNDTIRCILTSNSLSCGTPNKDTSNPLVMFVDTLSSTIFPAAIPDSICIAGSSTLSSGISATNFTVSSIPYDSIPVPAGAAIGPSGDDNVDGPYALPFSFNFFGNVYNQLYISTNGNIQFGPNFDASYTPGPLPNTTVLNFAALCWADVMVTSNGNGTTGQIRYFVEGAAPRRRMVIDWTDCSFYGVTSTSYISGQIWLYESSGVVETHLKKAIGFATLGGQKTIGVNNINGTIGAAAPGRNGTLWETTVPEAWRFTPPQNYSYTWSPAATLSDSAIENPVATPGTTTQYFLNVYNNLTGCSGQGTTTVTVVPPSAPTISINILSGSNPTCIDRVIKFKASITNGGSNPTFQWIKNGVNISGATDSIYTSSTLINNDTIRCRVTSNKLCVTTTIAISNNIRMTVIGQHAISDTVRLLGCNRLVYLGTTYTSSTTRIDTIRSTLGCDSLYHVAIITIRIVTPVTNNTSLSSCNTPIVYNGQSYDSSAIVRDTVRSVLGCDSIYNIATLTITYVNLASPSNLLPINNSTNLNTQIIFSWAPLPNALLYDVYIWKATDPIPTVPILSNISNINYTYSGLAYGTNYKWKVVAKNGTCSASSLTQNFTTRFLSDLIITNVQNPSTAFSGQPITVQWQVKNIGQGSTLSQSWSDAVFISTDNIFDAGDNFLGYLQNLASLNPNESYTQSETFTLPQGINDNYFIFVVADYYSQLLETNNTNNTNSSLSTTFIQLTPPPDLQVSSIVPPNFIFSGSTVNLTYTVTNKGTGGTVTTSWRDNLYLSNDTVLNGSSISLAYFYRNGALAKDSSYTSIIPVNIPQGYSGKYYFLVRTDASNNVYEFASENNNIGRSDSVKIFLTPPVDLIVTQVQAPANANNNENILVKWHTENAGGSSTGNNRWYDYVYISNVIPFNSNSAVYLGAVSHADSLAPGDGYDAQQNVTIPSNISGNYYIYVLADGGRSVYENVYENNNASQGNLLRVRTPDLIVTTVSIPVQDSSGKTIPVNWAIKNIDSGKIYNANITDRISISRLSTYNADSGIQLATVNYNTGQLAKDSTIPKSTQVRLPNGISGNYYVYVNTDFGNSLYESNEANNISRSTGFLKIIQTPAPDLEVSTITLQDSAALDDIVPISFTVKNNGPAALLNGNWKDKIYISSAPVWNTAYSTLLKEITQNRSLVVNAFYSVNTDIRIPATLADSIRFYIHIVTDADDNIYEYNKEANNFLKKDSVFIKKYPPVDLAMIEITGPDSAKSGQPISLSWKVKNITPVATIKTQWEDGLYLSIDSVWNKSTDILVKSITHNNVLFADSTYSTTSNITMPNGIAGQYYLLMVADHNDVNRDINRLNNYKLVKTNLGPVKIVITLTPPPDLVVTSFTIPQYGTAGQPVLIKYTIKNNGTGAANPRWSDHVYLSTNPYLDNGDNLIGSNSHNTLLPPGASYTDSLQAYLPINASGNYAVILKTDANDAVYEHTGENNNTSTAYIIVNVPPQSDIVVSSITPPAQAIAGDSITINWNIKNIGANLANGYMSEAVYLSEDTIKDANDILIANPQTYINIPPQSEISRSYTGDLTGVSLRNYHVIVHTDVRNNIYESNDTNNVTVSTDSFPVNVALLPLNIVQQKTLPNNKLIYYRVEVPDSLVGESLLITLKGDSVNGNNELYVKFDDVPNKTIYDYSHAQPYSGNQEIIIPTLKKGTYYLMITGQTTNGSVQQLDILAKVLSFEIRSVNADKGGNTGSVTVQLVGSKLANTKSIKLIKAGEIIIADTLIFVNPTLIYARFNLIGRDLGTYNVVAEDTAGRIAILNNGFQVVVGNPPIIAFNIRYPASTRPNNLLSIYIEFSNNGNIDVPLTTKYLISKFKAPIGLSYSELVNGKYSMVLQLLDKNEPLNILRPGGNGTLIIHTKAVNRLRFALVK